jgi:hypothetical protein
MTVVFMRRWRLYLSADDGCIYLQMTAVFICRCRLYLMWSEWQVHADCVRNCVPGRWQVSPLDWSFPRGHTRNPNPPFSCVHFAELNKEMPRCHFSWASFQAPVGRYKETRIIGVLLFNSFRFSWLLKFSARKHVHIYIYCVCVCL